MVKIRLQRGGRKKAPVYRIVASDSRTPRDGRFIERLGQYRPLENPPAITLKEDRVLYWLGVGAQPSDTVRNILSAEGVMLKVHLQRKNKSPEEIEQELAKWRAEKEARLQSKLSKKERRALKKKTEAPAAS